jgi:4-amino-4-deoxy-L-arabinose transferase-like glycosyltransferase
MSELDAPSMNRRWRPAPAAAAVLLIVLAALRIIPTYRTFSATTDEATHVGAGLELLQLHRYELQVVNPPAARVVLAIVPTITGMRFDPAGTYGDQLHNVFYGQGQYERNLFVSRIGNLVFLALASMALFLWTRREIDGFTAAIATFLFTFQPAFLGHAGLATNDAAATAALAVSLLAFSRWMEKPGWPRASVIGLAYAFAVLCKFSNIVFVPIACAGIFAVRLLHDRDRRGTLARGMVTLVVILAITPLVIWGGYAFTLGHLSDLNDVKGFFGPWAARLIIAKPSAPLPAPAFFLGVGEIAGMDQLGYLSYFRGESSTQGWALYFPATIALKTPIAFLILVFVAAFFAYRVPRLRWIMLESATAAALILAVSMRSRLDLGIRYILPIFIPLTMTVAAGTAAMLRSSRKFMVLAALLLGSYAVASAAAHPDYFPYFNAFAGRDPSRYLIDSNLDWSQDLLRLRSELEKLRVDRVGLFLMGAGDYRALHFPPDCAIDPFAPATGWVAVSDHVYRMEGTRGGWWWLADLPFRRVGKSIRLYHVPPGAFGAEPVGAQPKKTALVLLPFAGTEGEIARGGVKWRVRQSVTNVGKEMIPVVTNACPRTPLCRLEILPAQTISIHKPPDIASYVTISAEPIAALWLRFSTIVERTDSGGGGFAVPIPEVRENEFQNGHIVISNVPVSHLARLNLRLWALRGLGAVRYRVTVKSGGQVVAQRGFETGSDGFAMDGDLAREFHELDGRELTVDFEIDRVPGPDSRLWGFITATDNQTNLPTFFRPAPAR